MVHNLFNRRQCPADGRNGIPFSGFALDMFADSFASSLDTALRSAYRNRRMVAFNERSIDYVVTHDIQCGQLRGFTDEGQEHLGIGKPSTLGGRSTKQKC